MVRPIDLGYSLIMLRPTRRLRLQEEHNRCMFFQPNHGKRDGQRSSGMQSRAERASGSVYIIYSSGHKAPDPLWRGYVSHASRGRKGETVQQAETTAEARALSTSELSTKAQLLLRNINAVLVGQSAAARLAVIAFLAGGHVLIEDVPGVGKTLLAKSLAGSVQSDFKRIQCTPDLLPSDICGVSVFDSKEGSFKFIPGPIFTNILLADEINRATPRTQSSLLEAMEENQVTTDGASRKLPELFFVIATENPIEYHGTFPLPEAQLDRFMLSLSLGYPKLEQEIEILDKTLEESAFSVKAVLSENDVLEARRAIRNVHVDPSVKDT